MIALLVRSDVSLIFYDRIKLEEIFDNELKEIENISYIDNSFLKKLRNKLINNALESIR